MLSIRIGNNTDSGIFDANDEMSVRDFIETTRFRATPGTRVMYNGTMLAESELGESLRAIAGRFPSADGIMPVINLIAALKNA